MTPLEGLLKGRESWAEEGSVRKGNEVGRRCTANGSIGMGSGWGRRWAADIKFPQFGGGCSGTLENDIILVSDGDGGGGEGNITTGVAELSNAEERLGSKVGNDVAMAGGRRKAGYVEISFMGGVENRTGWGVDGDGSIGGTLVADRRGWGKEVGGASRISDGIVTGGGGRTGNCGRH